MLHYPFGMGGAAHQTQRFHQSSYAVDPWVFFGNQKIARLKKSAIRESEYMLAITVMDENVGITESRR